MSASAVCDFGWVGMTDRREGERRQLIDYKFIITIALSIGGAWIGSWTGSQTRTAVIERAVGDVEKSLIGVREQITGLTTLVNNSNIKSAGEIAELKAGLAAKDRENSEIRKQLDQLLEYHNLNVSRIDALRDRFSRVEGEMNATRKKE